MNFIFSTPRRHRIVGGFVFAANIGNILAFPSYAEIMASESVFMVAAGCITHLATMIILAAVAGHLASQSIKQRFFIRMMEDNGFQYDAKRKEFFKPD